MALQGEREFLDQYSVENIIRAATQPPAMLRLPAEYAQSKPDTLAMETDKLLSNMSGAMNSAQPQQSGFQNVQSIRQQPVDGGVLIPFRQDSNFKPMQLPVMVGRDIGLDEITDWVRKRESSGNYTALNKEKAGNTASGAYQYTDATWNGYGGYSKAMLAPKHVQDRRFAEDIAARFKKYGGDPFKMIAEHYLPALANDPSRWNERYEFKNGNTVRPVADYLAGVVKGTPLEKYLPQYLAQFGR